MTDHRSPLDFYGAPDAAALARRTGADAPPPPSPTTFEVFSAARALAQADLPSADRDRLYDAWQPVIDTLNEGRSWRQRYHNPYAGGDRTELQIFDPEGNFVFKPAARDDAEAQLWQAAKANPRTATMLPDSVTAFHDATTKRAKVRIGAARATVDRNDSWLGTAAQLAAGVETSFHDPINIAALPIGGVGSSIAKRLLTSGLANMAVEAIEQPFVAQQREKLGEKLTGREAAINIGAAGLFGAGMQGVGEAAAPLTRNLVDAARARWGNLTDNERVATRVIEREDDIVAGSPFQPGAGDDAHLARMEQATREILSQPSAAERIVPEAVPRTNRPVPAEVAAQRTMADPIEQFKGRVRRHESGGDDGATNPSSSATGRYQFIDRTWLHYARQFDETKGLPERGVLQLRSHPVWQERVMDAAIRDYRKLLANVGADETPGNLYLVHFAGEGGAKRILRAAADTPAERLFSPEAIAANPFLKGKDAGDVRAWAARAVGDVPSDAPRLRRDIFETTDEGDAAWRDAQAEVEAADAEMARFQQDDGPPIAREMDTDPLPGFDAFDAPARGDVDPFAFLDDAPTTRAGESVPVAWKDAIATMRQSRDGEIRGQVSHPALDAPIDVKWGKAGDPEADFRGGYGLAHILAKHPEMEAELDRLPELIASMDVKQRRPERMVLESADHEASVALTWHDENQNWLVTAYEKTPADPTSVRGSIGDGSGSSRPGATVNIVSPTGLGNEAETLRAFWQRGAEVGDPLKPVWAVREQGSDAIAWWNPSKRAAEKAADDMPGDAWEVVQIAPDETATAPTSTRRAEGFDHPADVGAVRQMESLERELRDFLRADDAQGLTVRLNDEGDVVSAADALAELDEEDAAIGAVERAWRGLDNDDALPFRQIAEGERAGGPMRAATERANALREAAVDRAIDRVLAEERGEFDTRVRRAATTQLRQALIRRDAEHWDDEFFRTQIERILGSEYEERAVKRYRGADRDRERGADFVREKLLQAKRQGSLDAETVDFTEWFVRQNPALLDDLGISVRQSPADDVSARGTYNPAARLMSLFKGQDASTTAVHEILHHTERMMPAEFQAAIRAEWSKRVAKLATSKDEGERAFGEAVLKVAAAPSATKLRDAIKMMPAGSYHLVNPSEFWAVNASALLERRHAARGSVFARIRTWLGEMTQHVRAALRLSSDAPVLRALDQLIARGDGQVRGGMLASATRYAAEGQSGLGRYIPALVKSGEISAERGRRMQSLFDELQTFYRGSMGPDAAAAEASEATLKQLRAEQRLKKRQTLLQINRQRDALKDLDRFQGKNRYAAVSALLDDDDRAAYRSGNVTTAATRIEFQMHGRIAEFIERHRRTLLGKPRDQTGLENVVRELHGQATGDDVARTAAQAVGDTFEALRLRFNAAGGAIRKLEGYGLTHRHDAMKVRAVSREQWIADTVPELDRAKMIDDRTGEPMTDARLTEVLSDVYETIRTNGLAGPASAIARGAGKLANRRAEARFLHFKDGDAWLRYDQQYGSGDSPFTSILQHIAGMSKDIAMMERLGPNPDATVRYLLDHVDRLEAQSDKKIVGAVMGAAAGRKRSEDLWRYIKGDSAVPVMPESRIGYHALRTVQGTRNLLTSAMLGSAPLSAISDVNSGLIARGFYGIPEARVLGSMLGQLNPLSDADRALAVRLGAGMREASQSMASIARYYGESSGPGWTQVMADSVLRVSGLNKWTEAGQNAFVVDLLGALGDVRDRSWDELPEQMRLGMERNGISAYDWQDIRSATPIMTDSGTYIDPQAMMDPRVGDRLMDMVLRGRAQAVQETTATSRALTTMGTSPGTLGGEVLRNSLQFKGFAVALLMKHGRILSILPPRQQAMYAARFFIGMTMFGAATIQLREIAKGRDPKPMDNIDFWKRAALQGGGIGIAGDLIGMIADPRLGSIAEFMGGPFVSFATDLKKAAFKAMPGDERADGTRRAPNPGGAAVDLARRYTPGGNLWYLRAAYERLIIDQLQADWDDDYDQAIARKKRAAEKDGTGYWWAPGAVAPERAPDLANAGGRAEGM